MTIINLLTMTSAENDITEKYIGYKILYNNKNDNYDFTF